jgi:AbrB family looped-hinge helix DNA binding protein
LSFALILRVGKEIFLGKENDMPYSTLTSKGQTTIPREIRKLLGLRENDRILYEVENGKVAIKPAPSVHELYAIFKPHIRRRGAPPTKAQMRAAVERDLVRRWKKKGV